MSLRCTVPPLVVQEERAPADCWRVPVFDDGRKHKRQKRDAVDLLWLVEGRQVAGKGRLIDISMTGLCVEMSGNAFPVQAGLTVLLQIPDIPVAPKRARMRWYRRVAHRSPVYLCGLTFPPPYDQAWVEWVSQYIEERYAPAKSGRVLGFVLKK